MTAPEDHDIVRRSFAATVLQAGDRVLLTTGDAIEVAFLTTMKVQLEERFRGVEFTVVAGITDIAVQR